MFRVRRVLEILLEMDERARGLDQSFEKIIVARVVVQPEMLEDVVRFVVTLLVPAAKEGPVTRIFRNVARKIDIAALEIAHELRNPLAFVHGALNFIVPEMMGKPTFPEGHEISLRRVRPLADVRGRSDE